MKKTALALSLITLSTSAYAADLTVTVGDKDLAKFCEQPQFNTYKPEHNPDAKSFDCTEFVQDLFAGQIEQGANTVYEAEVAADVKTYKQNLIATAKQAE